jgi:hypothetical protein
MNVPVYRTTVSSTTKSMPRMSEVVTPQLNMAIVANSIKHPYRQARRAIIANSASASFHHWKNRLIDAEKEIEQVVPQLLVLRAFPGGYASWRAQDLLSVDA